MRKKRKNKIVLLVIILIIIFFLMIGNLLYNKKQDKKFTDTLKYYQCTYYKTLKSKENEFEKDIYMKIPYMPVDNQGNSNQYYYEQIIKTVATLIEKRNFRILDQENDIVLRVRFENGVANYTINGENNYYETKKASMIPKNNKALKISTKSNELLKFDENNWKRAEIREIIGNADKNDNGYDIYQNLGIKFSSINLNIYNVIFTTDYKNEVFEGIKTGLDNTEIRKILGKPNFENSNANMLIGYLTDKYYVFFSNGEISIYRTEIFDKSKNEEFAKILSELLNNKNYNDFLNKLTETYPNFSEYNKNENGIEIKYPHLGFKVNFHNDGKSGITLYNNYNGKITEDLSMIDVNNGKPLPSNIYFENKDGIFENELQRLVKSVKKNNNRDNH